MLRALNGTVAAVADQWLPDGTHSDLLAEMAGPRLLWQVCAVEEGLRGVGCSCLRVCAQRWPRSGCGCAAPGLLQNAAIGSVCNVACLPACLPGC